MRVQIIFILFKLYLITLHCIKANTCYRFYCFIVINLFIIYMNIILPIYFELSWYIVSFWNILIYLNVMFYKAKEQ